MTNLEIIAHGVQNRWNFEIFFCYQDMEFFIFISNSVWFFMNNFFHFFTVQRGKFLLNFSISQKGVKIG